MSESQAALTVRGVRKTFEAENAPVRALRGVDLTVAEGDFVALMRPHPLRPWLLPVTAGWLLPPAQLVRRTHPHLPHRARQVRRDLASGGRVVRSQHRRVLRPTVPSRQATPCRVGGRSASRLRRWMASR
jgi:hypothetical protein